MFRCQKCQSVVGPGVSQTVVPTGFKRDAEGNLQWGERLGEVALCRTCAAAFESQKESTAEGLDGVHFTFLNGVQQ